ncbi:transposase [Nonomuraea sp. NPDC003709]|uniref:transposase n=1 Tax=Nonomuraea sp. NPDC003709 TaxID=3154450 RepID=UPI0033BB0034
MAARAGARLAARLGLPVAKDTLLRLVRAAPEPQVGAVRVVAVDDFALRKRASHATIVVDLEARRPVDVLQGREAEPVAAWLAAHPEIEVVCRDRARAYAEAIRAEAIRTGAPPALDVADRWHLWHNLAEAADATVRAHHTCVKTALAEPAPAPVLGEAAGEVSAPRERMLDVRGRPRSLVARTAERCATVQQLVAEGRSLRESAATWTSTTTRCAATRAPPDWRNCWPRPPIGVRCWTGSSPTCTSASPATAVTTPRSCFARSPHRATAAARVLSTGTYDC